ncbi:MAG: hypothetical protein VYD19_06665 [Myxococcota bacterium]|nr:hypothetical protein [Myxococcota bacterium]
MPPLKIVLSLMALVSTLMIAALFHRKMNEENFISYGELRAIDRLCQRHVDQLVADLHKQHNGEVTEVRAGLRRCMEACRTELIDFRLKATPPQDWLSSCLETGSEASTGEGSLEESVAAPASDARQKRDGRGELE